VYKAKTSRKILSIFCAVLGVVFAFITGITYCSTSLNLKYGAPETSTLAYMGNRQYHIINDTETNAIPFGEGLHSTEIALQYSYDYDFDVRIAYSLSWSKSESESELDTSNVILNFVNRDNIIYDENYIYFARKVSAGSGKITIISGVEFVDIADETYKNRTLTINISSSSVKICRAEPSYSNDSTLYKDNTSSIAAQAWLQFKSNQTAETSSPYIVMYNYRRNHEHGVKYPGASSAYKKPVDSGGNITSSYSWDGGNRAYAGIGMYVIAGSEALQLEVMVAGVWRSSTLESVAGFISENSIQFNYSSNWTHVKYDEEDHLWAYKYYSLTIPAKAGCYIEICDSIEIISAGRIDTNGYDDYRMVANRVLINPSLEEAKQTLFKYDETTLDHETECKFIQYSKISTSTTAKQITGTYSQPDIEFVNTSIYNNGLYDIAAEKASGDLQTFNTSISVINNTAQAKSINVGFDLYYHVSNGKKDLYYYNSNDTSDAKNYLRASDYIDVNKTVTYEKAFISLNTNSDVCNYYYSHTAKAAQSKLGVALTSNVIEIAPYSSIALVDKYSVSGDLRTDIKTAYDDTNTTEIDYHDVWTYLVPTYTVNNTVSSLDLSLESRTDETSTIISVKNNTNKIITNFTIADFSVRQYAPLYAKESSGTEPKYWSLNFWKYYEEDASGNKIQLKTASAPTYQANKYYILSQEYVTLDYVQDEAEEVIITLDSKFQASGTGVALKATQSISLNPGESVDIATVNTTDKIMLSGIPQAQTIQDVEGVVLVNSGLSSAYIMNSAFDKENENTGSFYVRFKGSCESSNIYVCSEDGYNYFIGVVRPDQIINMAGATNLEFIKAQSEFDVSHLTNWHENAKDKMENFFSFEKNN